MRELGLSLERLPPKFHALESDTYLPVFYRLWNALPIEVSLELSQPSQQQQQNLKDSRITLYVEDFTDDQDVVESLLHCFRIHGPNFVQEVVDDAIDSISRDFRSRREVSHPGRLVAARVKRSIRRRDMGLSPRRARRREPSRSRSLSGVKPGRRVVVEEFARKYGVDAECEMRLKRLNQEQLQRVCGGDLIIHRDCRNVSSLIMARIRDEMRGRLPDVVGIICLAPSGRRATLGKPSSGINPGLWSCRVAELLLLLPFLPIF
ncbi:hypothetical protein FOZ61_000579 [Perkinsus olseni]|uniref:Uncharacterized protein n=1 Tax=Perkinsus olseni TaxID=32597 RepID=A0A7J6LZL3_PEROL|nr:hypothetical protein FOZ61_000579 [Perkinsus olseni]